MVVNTAGYCQTSTPCSHKHSLSSSGKHRWLLFWSWFTLPRLPCGKELPFLRLNVLLRFAGGKEICLQWLDNVGTHIPEIFTPVEDDSWVPFHLQSFCVRSAEDFAPSGIAELLHFPKIASLSPSLCRRLGHHDLWSRFPKISLNCLNRLAVFSGKFWILSVRHVDESRHFVVVEASITTTGYFPRLLGSNSNSFDDMYE